MPQSYSPYNGVPQVDNPDYRRIEKAIRFLERHAVNQPSLHDVADHIGLSPCHLQRLFRRWAGVSPKRFLQYLTIEKARQLLRESASVLDTAFEVGLSGPGRLHDLFVNVEAVTPGEFKSLGKGLDLRYGFHPTPFGDCLVATTPRGICSLSFVEQNNRDLALAGLRDAWKKASIIEDLDAGRATVTQIFTAGSSRGPEPIKVLLRGTNFQLKVWEALLRIPPGAVVSYRALADAVGHPGATRAVGTTVGRNPIAFLIPCHRVLRSTGEIGGYRWGTARKRAMLAREAAKRGEKGS